MSSSSGVFSRIHFGVFSAVIMLGKLGQFKRNFENNLMFRTA